MQNSCYLILEEIVMNRRVGLSVLIVIWFCGVVQAGEWSRTGNLNVVRDGQSGVVLTDGRVMMLGGGQDEGGNPLTYEIFDPATGTWWRGNLPAENDHDGAILLPNGKVLHIPNSGGPWLYDTFAKAWNRSAASTGWANSGCATLLKDGKALLMYNTRDCRLYDHVTDALIPAASARISHGSATEVMLPSGEVLVMGGTTDGYGCELYDPVSGSWSNVGSTSVHRQSHVAVLLPPPWSKVLIAAGPSAGNVCELYDPGTGLWTSTGDLNYATREIAAMALLPSGEALIVGGGTHSFPDRTNHRCELYNPATETWTVADSTQYPRNHFDMAILVSGKVLTTGSATCGSGTAASNKVEIYDPSEPVWTARTPLHYRRSANTVTPLPIIHTKNCSTNVLIAGGEDSGGFLKSSEIYNYILESTVTTGDFNVERAYHTAVLLPSGKVLAAGGKNAGGELRSCELFDVRTESWTSAGNMSAARYNHTATLLKNGDVLVTGGESVSGVCLNSCEVYVGGTWVSVGITSTSISCHTAVLLLDGRVLVIGGKTAASPTVSCEIWNGTVWSAAAPLSAARYFHTATVLQSGRVLVVGGNDSGGNALVSCEVYNPATDVWSSECDLNEARALHNTILLYSGLVLVSGGQNASGCLSSCEIWDPAAGWDPTPNTHAWKVTAPLASPRYCHTSVLIPDDQPYVLSMGGIGSAGWLNSVEEYDVGLKYRPEWQSTITNFPSVTHISDSMQIEGTLFRGVSEADGGNHCHTVSNDHPIISFVRVGGGNWQGNGGGELMYIPLSSYWDETHTHVHLPADAGSGYYRLWSIVNGIPCKWYAGCAGVEEHDKTESQKLKAETISVYPNPSTSGSGVRFHLELSTVDRGLSTISIYDLGGRLVRSLSIHHSPFTIHQLKPGIYFYRIESFDCHSELVSESGVTTGKFTIVE
jgi:hypothetical protein